MATVYRVDKCPHCGKPIRQRSSEQNAGLHAALQDIANQIDWPRGSGTYLDVEAWKRLMVYAYQRSTQDGLPNIYPAIDGHGFDIVYSHTSRMSKEQLSELFDFVVAQGAEWNVRWSDGKDAA